MQKSEDGLWSVTVGPLDPEMYVYYFTVDGVRLLDPSNAQVKIGYVTSTMSLPKSPDTVTTFASGARRRKVTRRSDATSGDVIPVLRRAPGSCAAGVSPTSETVRPAVIAATRTEAHMSVRIRLRKVALAIVSQQQKNR